MLYKSLLDGMLLSAYSDTGTTYETTFPCVFERTFKDLHLDADKHFSDGFLKELGKLQEPSYSKLGGRLPKGLTECKNLRDLVLVFYSIVRDLGLGDAASPDCGRVSEKMFIEYVYEKVPGAKTEKPFNHYDTPNIRLSGGRHRANPPLTPSIYDLHPSTESKRPSLIQVVRSSLTTEMPKGTVQHLQTIWFTFDRTLLQQKVKPMIDFWHGLEPLAGPTDMEEMSRKCGSCSFAKKCPQRSVKLPDMFGSQPDLSG
jgi:hypothetical protein